MYRKKLAYPSSNRFHFLADNPVIARATAYIDCSATNIWIGMTIVIDFDTNDWMPSLEAALGDLIPRDLRSKIAATDFNFQEDALAALEASADIDTIIDATLAWIETCHVRIYHGTRLTDDDADRVKQIGLKPLVVEERVAWLRAAVPELSDILTVELVENAIAEGSLSYRGNQVHAAISLKLMNAGYDYLLKGSEFDRRLLEYAGREDLVSVLTSRGSARLVKIVVTGREALEGMHPIFTITDVRMMERYPNFVRELLSEYLWALCHPDRDRHGVDACLMFKRSIPGSQIEDIVKIDESVAVA